MVRGLLNIEITKNTAMHLSSSSDDVSCAESVLELGFIISNSGLLSLQIKCCCLGPVKLATHPQVNFEPLALQCTTETFGGLCRHCRVLVFVLLPMKLHGDIPTLFVECYFAVSGRPPPPVSWVQSSRNWEFLSLISVLGKPCHCGSVALSPDLLSPDS